VLANEAAGGAEPADVFVYDPEVPVLSPAAGTDQSGVEMGNNLLVYTSGPLLEAVHVFGRPTVALHVATSADSADVAVKLVRVTESGRAEFVCMGVARSAHLFGQAYAADEVRLWTFAMEPTSCVFAKGERIRLEVAGCAFPLYDRNPSKKAVKAREMSPWNWARSTHRVLHDAEHASALTLPVMEVRA
jgi:putative CocE/NonD family hydrolase